MKNFNKGAMFGLDARIALAIFGALSVISGAALYSAIQSANAEKWRQYFVEVVKATEAYYLDNAEYRQYAYPSYQDLRDGLGSNSNSLSTWKGPYLQVNGSFYDGFKDSQTNSLSTWVITKTLVRTGSDWTEMNDIDTDSFCTVNSDDCYEWITLYANADANVKDSILNIFNSLDELVDNSDGALTGKVRYWDYKEGAVMYQGMRHKRTS